MHTILPMINLDTIKGNNFLDNLQLTTQKFDIFEISDPSDVTIEKDEHCEVNILGK